MNLFRQLLEPAKAADLVGPRATKTFGLGLVRLPWNASIGDISGYVFAAFGMIVVTGGLLVGLRVSKQAQIRALSQLVADGESALARTPLVTSIISRAPAEALSAESADRSWTALVWKLASSSGPGIVFSRVEMTTISKETADKTGSETAGARRVTVEGEARSLPILKLWVESLMRNVTRYQFVMESQTSDGKAPFPVRFRITGRGA